MIKDNARRKIQDLIDRGPELWNGGNLRDDLHAIQCRAYIAEALNIISYVIPSPKHPYRVSIEGMKASLADYVGSISQILLALIGDIDQGLLGNLGNQVRAETFDNFLDHAMEYFKVGRKMEAGVIAGVVFEDTVRRVYRDKIGEDKDIKLEVLINELKSQSFITGQQSKQFKVAAHVRTKATHAQWDEFDLDGVQQTIQITRLLLAEHLEA